MLLQMYEHNETCLNVDCMNIYAFDPQLYNSLVMYPSEVLVLLDKEAATIVAEIAGEDNVDFTIEVNQVLKPSLLVFVHRTTLRYYADVLKLVLLTCLQCLFAK